MVVAEAAMTEAKVVAGAFMAEEELPLGGGISEDAAAWLLLLPSKSQSNLRGPELTASCRVSIVLICDSLEFNPSLELSMPMAGVSYESSSCRIGAAGTKHVSSLEHS